MNIVFLGPPGAGKGTQAALVSKICGIPHISTGEILRSAIAKGNEIGVTAKHYIDNGQLVPDDVILYIVEKRLLEPDCNAGFLFDGFPRTRKQAETFDEMVTLDFVVNVHVDDEVIIGRLSGRRTCIRCGHTTHVTRIGSTSICPECGGSLATRDDDREDIIANRLNIYHSLTRPLIEFYKEKGVLRIVDGNRDLEIVKDQILKEIGYI